jgi:diketogulonate reductase-like aldo/keto reductase
VLLAWAVQRGTALLTTPRTAARARENLDISALPEDALDEINRKRPGITLGLNRTHEPFPTLPY